MPGPRMLVLMLTPTLMAFVLLLLIRRDRPTTAGRRVRGVWLAIAALLVHLAVVTARAHVDLPESAINRSGAAFSFALLAYFVWMNRSAVRATVVGVWLIACGGGLNAAATLAYGAMPALGSAARVAGYDVGSEGHPFPGYVLSDHLSPLARYSGDFIPIPGQLKVLSIGDLMLMTGLVIVLLEAIRSVWSRPTAVPDSA